MSTSCQPNRSESQSSFGSTGASPESQLAGPLRIGPRELPTRTFLAPLAGYTHLAFRRILRELGGVGLATTDLVPATLLLSQNRRSMQLIETTVDDDPLSVQIYSGHVSELVRAARWLEDHGYQGIDINMGCPMAKVNGQGGGARLMRDTGGACGLVGEVVAAVDVPVTVKMRLGWDRSSITAPALAREFERLGVAAVTLHGRTRQQGFHGQVQIEPIAETVAAVNQMPIIANGDIRSVDDALNMWSQTGCAAIAIGRGAMLDPWLFRKINDRLLGRRFVAPDRDEQVRFLRRHFELMTEQHGEYSCTLFRKFAAWYGVVLGIPEDLEDRLRRFESATEFEDLCEQVRQRHGERESSIPTALIKVPNGPVERW